MSLSDALADQAGHCAALGSPFMARILPLLAEVWPAGSALDAALRAFTGDIGPKGHSLPLRLASGLHALVLTGQDADLIAAYPPNDVSDQALRTALTGALARHEAFLTQWITSPPQTNEVRRSALLIAGAHALVHRTGVRDLRLSELGASAGLNLMFDRYALDAGGTRLGPEDAALTLSPDWVGPAPMAAPFTVCDRRGVDLNPLDPHNPDHALRLRAYLWADQEHRLTLTNAAIRANAAEVDRGDAVDWLDRRLADAPEGQMHLIYHTIAWQYFPAERQATGTALIEAAGARATADAPLAWLRMEADGETRGASVTARLWPGDHHITLGRADFHGRWVDWADNPA
ncbi:DUF2332 domain-containing protein [Marivita geojedonensis]|uniref:DUF2332 domain-containing protein n=1 Tax=Marivita geojedonensis TaxID=1123756 RepID=A0A1X4NLZ2_9RHOB|nr:DUF2332 domain-containing protein [Marivita geojedonensis]OSQ51386.1 hypothetical protein MGEO_07910 [Marivita geojedonensis]PRY77952.1 hypothetical protein CLV76_107138 [Marivita geojedonensis]